MRISQKIVSLAVSVPAVAVAVLGMAPQAQADAGQSCLDSESNCGVFYYNSGREGSFTAFRGSSVSNLSGYTFLTSGAGKGVAVKNNAASFYNASDQIATVFYSSGYGGACDTFAKFAATDRLHYTYNENASLGFGKSGVNCYKFS
ncbi:peptidase inhibitor family I36 protein [Streptomyces sp. NBC_01445]|uniref:peptidase inhibitor family I36 protein n=1 Tax=Streptomyces sp. NBC_01445 TaxID=2903869 RepID=UPI002DD8FCED|nr:peptidase inhibitor family I36 protein [Streptomyces sp. NBC_01445]WSE04923.1 peptidase inhibitor family I36 protein [Streptomyces sp. NBC_01445]